MDDAELVARAREGDRTAWGGIYDRYADRLHDHCWSILRDEHEAADALHDAFVAAAGAIDQLRDPSRLRPWLYAIARNEAFRRHRKRSRAVPTDELPEMTATVDEPAPAHDLQRLVWDAAGGLSPDDQSLLDLHLRQGLDGQDLAEALGITANNAYVKLHRLRETLERSLGALLVARTGSEDCEELQRLTAGWDGTLSPLLRKRIARHVDGCEICGDRKRRLVSPLALLAAVPLLPAPSVLRERILDDTVAASSNRPAGRGRGRGPRRRGGLVLGAAAAVLVAVVAALLVTGGEDEPAELVAAGDVTTTTADDPTTSTSAAPTTTIPAGPVVLPPPSADTLPPGAPPPPPPPSTTAGPTSIPPTTTATTAPPSPGVIELSTGALDFGDTATTRSLTVRNTGGQPVDVTATPGSAAVSVSPAGTTTIAPGQSVQYTVGLDRSSLAEGTVDERVRFSGRDVAVTGEVRRPPTAGTPTISPSTFQTTCSSTNRTASVSAAVSDDSGIRSVVLHWSGPGSPGSKAISQSGTGTLGPFTTAGTGEAWVVVTDVFGNQTTSGRRPFTVNPCPG